MHGDIIKICSPMFGESLTRAERMDCCLSTLGAPSSPSSGKPPWPTPHRGVRALVSNLPLRGLGTGILLLSFVLRTSEKIHSYSVPSWLLSPDDIFADTEVLVNPLPSTCAFPTVGHPSAASAPGVVRESPCAVYLLHTAPYFLEESPG